MSKVNTNKAFSLLEMAISITIISLLIAAVLTGQALKRRQELNQVIADIGNITSAAKQFRSIYSNYYPGDYYTSDLNNGTNTSVFYTSGDGSGYLETSNVDPVKEMTDLISAQRAYEINSKVIQAADDMAGTVSKGLR